MGLGGGGWTWGAGGKRKLIEDVPIFFHSTVFYSSFLVLVIPFHWLCSSTSSVMTKLWSGSLSLTFVKTRLIALSSVSLN